jgi:hypothetical protein
MFDSISSTEGLSKSIGGAQEEDFDVLCLQMVVSIANWQATAPAASYLQSFRRAPHQGRCGNKRRRSLTAKGEYVYCFTVTRSYSLCLYFAARYRILICVDFYYIRADGGPRSLMFNPVVFLVPQNTHHEVLDRSTLSCHNSPGSASR